LPFRYRGSGRESAVAQLFSLGVISSRHIAHMPATTPNPAVIAAILSGIGIVITIVGWFVQHHLTKRREVEKDRRAKAEAEAAQKEAIAAFTHLTQAQREIITHCIDQPAPMQGSVLLLGTSGFGSWVRAGKKDFMDPKDQSVQARYLDAFESLLSRGFFRCESGRAYRLTSRGYENAKNDT
jgi:hypothetical protein